MIEMINKYLNELRHPWNWSDDQWKNHVEQCELLFGINPKKPERPNPDEQTFVILKNPKEIKHIKDLRPSHRHRIDCYLPTIKQMKNIIKEKQSKNI